MKITVETEVGIGLGKGNFQEKNISRRNDRSTSNSRSRSGSRASTNRDGIRCHKCREYDHFAKHCPTSKEEREIEQIQQMYNLDEEQTSLKTLATDMFDSLNKINSIENIMQEHLKLVKGKNEPTAFLLLNANTGGQITPDNKT